MNFLRRFKNEEESTRQQDEFLATKAKVAYGEQFGLQRDDPTDGKQKNEPHSSGYQQTCSARTILLICWKL
jgi:hypothetical protein